MKIVIAPDSFKGSLTAAEVCHAIEKGVLQHSNKVEVVKVPMADGGEGTLETLMAATGGKIYEMKVRGPLGQSVNAHYGILGNGKTAVIEMASASGLPLVPLEIRNPLLTTTYGTGELIISALDRGCRDFIIGIGGSATNDGGAGMAQALGVSLVDTNGNEMEYGGGILGSLARIDMSQIDPRIKECTFNVACDVTNPLCGERGASAIFGPQKGATPEVIKILDRSLCHFAQIIKRDLGKDVGELPGSGAAGGLGAGLIAFCNAQLKRGIDIIVEAVGLTEKMRGAQLVITGEGQMDGQTSQGKTPYGVAMLARGMGIPTVAIVGSMGAGAEEMFNHGISTIFSIVSRPEQSLDDCVNNAAQYITSTAHRLMRAIYLYSD